MTDLIDTKTAKLLKEISSVPEGQWFGYAKELKPHTVAGFIEGNPALKNPANDAEYAFRIRPEGIAAMNAYFEAHPPKAAKAPKTEAPQWGKTDTKPAAKKAPAKKAAKKAPVANKPAKKAPAAKAPKLVPVEEANAAEAADGLISQFVIANVPMPKIERNLERGSKYPFDQLGHFADGQGQSFFIERKKGDNRSASKAFGSLVASANKRFGTKADFRRFTARHIADGKDYGQPGKVGVGIFRLPKAEEDALRKALK